VCVHSPSDFFFLFGAVALAVRAGNPAPANASQPQKPVVLVKAESIKVKSFEVKEWELGECLSYLRKKSVEEDPEKAENMRGLGFVWSAGSLPVPRVTLSLKNASVWEICQRLAKITGLTVSVSNFKIHFHPKGKRPEPGKGEIFYDAPPKSGSKRRVAN
jgi:hypothetical protein